MRYTVVLATMAKLLLIAFALGIVGSTKTFKEFVYDYETQVMSGLPVGSKIYSGLKLFTQVHFQMVGEFEAKMEFRSPRLFWMNSPINNNDPTREMVPNTAFTELLDTDAVNMKTFLVKPISFTYVRGQVENVKTAGSDPEWSVNIKKGFLSMMELNFNERHSLDPHVEVMKSGTRQTVYRVFEPSLTGDCETTYKMKMNPEIKATYSMGMVKVRNFENCKERIMFTADMMNGKPCANCNPVEAASTYTAQSTVRYEIRGTPESFQIISAVGESMYAYVPMAEPRGRLMTFTNQKMTLVETKENVAREISNPSSPFMHTRPLRALKSPRDDRTKTKPYVLENPERVELVKKAIKALTGIAKMNSERVEVISDEFIKEIWRLFREMDQQALTEVMEEAMKKTTMPKNAWKTMIDILPTVGTFESFDVLMKWMETYKPEPETALITYMAISTIPEPNLLIVNRYIDHIKKYQMEPTDRNVWTTAWLSFGSLGLKLKKWNRMVMEDLEAEIKILTLKKEESNIMGVHQTMEKRIEELRNKVTEISRMYETVRQEIITMVEDLYKTEKKPYKVLALKVISNLGFTHFLPFIEKLALDKSEGIVMRQEAMECIMRHVRQNVNLERVRRMVLPIYFDFTEPEELRLTAFFTVVQASPSKSELEMIAKYLHNEPSRNVGSFVWDTLVVFSNTSSTCDCIKSLVHNTTLALRYAKRPEENFRYSSLYVNRYFDEVRRQGYTTTTGLLFSHKERFPTSFVTCTEMTIHGRSFMLNGFEFRGRGIDTIYESFYKSPKFDALKKMLSPKFKRSISDAEEYMENIKEKINVKPRNPVIPEGTLEFNFLDQIVYYFDIEPFLDLNKDTLSKETPKQQMAIIQTKVLNALPKMVNIVSIISKFLNTERSFYFPLIHTVMPTEMGLPVYTTFNWLGAVRTEWHMPMKPNTPQHDEGSLYNMFSIMFNFKQSGFVQTETNMNVDMRYYRSGTTTKIRVFFDQPMTVAMDGDFTKSKFHMKITDMKQVMPFAFEAYSETFFYWIPFKASEYPKPMNKKELLITANSHVEIYSYEAGRDFFGFKYTVEGHWTRPKSANVEQFPMCGKRTLYVKFDPMLSKEWEFYAQHTKEFVKDGLEIEEQESWISGMFSSLFSSKDKENRPQDPKERKLYTKEPVEPFINLKERDLTVGYLEGRFVNDTKLLNSGLKCGFVITITRPGLTPGYKTQFTTLYQMDYRGLNFYYTMDLTHFSHETPHQPWKMLTTMKMSLPNKVTEPSSLLDNVYQRQVEDQINREVNRNERDLVDGFDFSYYIMVNSVKQFMLSELRDHRRVGIHELINHVLEQSVSNQLEKVEMLVQDQRRIEQEARALRNKPIDLEKIDSIFNDFERMLEYAEMICHKVEGLFAAIQSPEKPEESIMVQYLLISQTNTLNEFGRFLRNLKVVVSPQRYAAIHIRFETLYEKLYKATKDQLKLSLDKQSVEKQRAGMDIEPMQINIHTKLIDIEKKLAAVLDKTIQPTSQRYETTPFGAVPELKQVVALCQEILLDMNRHLEKDPVIDKMLRAKMGEVLLQLTQMMQVIDSRIRWIKEGTVPEAPIPSILQEKEHLLEIRQQCESLVEAYATRILLAANIEKERKYLLPSMTQEMQEDIRSLNSINIRHIQIIEMLNTSPAKQLSVPWLQELVGKVTQVNSDLKKIIKKELFNPNTILKLNPVVMKCGRMLSEQLEIYERLCNLLDAKFQLDAANNRNVDSVQTLRKTIWALMDDTYKLISQAYKEFQKSPSNDVLTMMREHREKGTPSLSSLVKQSVAVDALHLHMKSQIGQLIRDLTKELQHIHDRKPMHSSYHQLELKEHLYKVLNSAALLQKNCEDLGRTLTDELTQRPSSESLQELHASLEKRLEKMISDIQSVEHELKTKTSSDPSILPSLQSLQQIKDKLQRYHHSYKLEKPIIPSKTWKEKSVRYDPKLKPWDEEQWSPEEFVSQITAEATLCYGPNVGPKKTVVFKFVGSKTLQQLMWERDQIQPSKQDPIVKKYLADKALPNDKTALGYRHIKSELNTYRKMHFFCTYEETLPFPFKNYMYRVHQFFKFHWYNEAHVSLPIATVSPANHFELAMDFDRNQQWMSVLLTTNYEVMNIAFLPVPWYLRTGFFPPTINPKEVMIFRLVGDTTRSCPIIPRRIQTFDGNRYMPELSSKPCETVMAMDCSPSHEFVVTRTPISPTSQRVTLVTKEHKVDVEKDAQTGKVVAYINGKPLDFSKTPIKIDTSGSPILISKDYRGHVMVLVPHVGVYVDSDGEMADIRVSRYHKGKLCGVCGNMDGIMENDLTGPGKVLYPEPKSLVSTYMVHSDKCDVRSLQKVMKVPEIREYSSRKSPVMETAVLETILDGRSVTCFSIKPIKKCPPKSTPQLETSITIAYHCVKSSRQAAKLKHDAAIRVLHEMEGTSPDYHAPMRLPGYCRRI